MKFTAISVLMSLTSAVFVPATTERDYEHEITGGHISGKADRGEECIDGSNCLKGLACGKIMLTGKTAAT